MDIGIHLPQYGRVASAEAVQGAARKAEQLGFADVWVSDHIVHPADQSYPSPYLCDPVVTLSWAAAVTDRIRLGTTVLVLPQRSALETANTFASLDYLSGGRVVLGVGVGWSEAEFSALGRPFGDRGRRTDEMIDVLRACWNDDPVSFSGEYHSFDNLRVLPKPAHRIAMWVGGGVEASYRRAVERGDGFQFVGKTPEEVAPVIERLRRDRPEPEFTISARTGWDPQGMDPGVIADEYKAFEAAGVQHMVCAPWRSDLDEWIKSMELLADLVL